MVESFETGCFLLDEIVENANPQGLPASGRAEVVRPVIADEISETWSPPEGEREFQIILHDKSVVTVAGSDLQYVPNSDSSDAGSYAVIAESCGRRLTVALFPMNEVAGIFSGERRLPGPI